MRNNAKDSIAAESATLKVKDFDVTRKAGSKEVEELVMENERLKTSI